MSPAPKDPNLPVHVAIIMDGNGRWARNRSKPRHAGHRAGVKSVRRTIEHAARLGVRHLTLFAFSSENFQRPPNEVSALMALFVEALQREFAELHRNNVRLTFIGERQRLEIGPFVFDITSDLPEPISIEPPADGPQIYVVSRGLRVEHFSDFGDFASRVNSLLRGGSNMRALTARGAHPVPPTAGQSSPTRQRARAGRLDVG